MSIKKIVLAVLVFCPLTAFAQGGSEALPFIRTDLGTVLTGTAGAAVASSEIGAWTAFRSAAAAPFAQQHFELATDLRSIGGHSALSAAALFNFKKAALSVGASFRNGERIADYMTREMVLSAGYGQRVTENLSLGFNGRFAKQILTKSISYAGYSADFSALYRFSEYISATAGVAAIGSKVKSASGSVYSQPSHAYGGAEFSTIIGNAVVSADVMAEYYYLSGSYAMALSAKYFYDDRFYFSGGYRYADQLCVYPSQISFGVGFVTSYFTLDASYVRMMKQNILSLGAGIRF